MNLFRRRAPAPTLPPDVFEAMAALQQLAETRPALAKHAAMLADVLPALAIDPGPTPEVQLSDERIAAKWEAGEPLLRGETVSLDAGMFRRRWGGLTGLLAPHVGKESAQRLALALEGGELRLHEILDWVLSGHITQLRDRSLALGLDGGVTESTVRWMLFAPFTKLQASLASRLPQSPWPHGYCPVCGSWPILGEFRGLEQFRFLRCGLCAAAWQFPRLRCPFCGTDDHRQLGYLHREGEEGKERVTTCDACHGYVKMVATLTPLEPVQLLVLEAATLPLDLIAARQGYLAPG